jgi:hypothetical protein
LSKRSEDFPDPDAAKFADVRADMARLYMRHRSEVALALASHEWIIANTNDLTATLYCLSVHAMDHGDEAWLLATVGGYKRLPGCIAASA